MYKYILGTILGLQILVGHLALADRPVIKVDGSSTVFPITEAVAEEYQKSVKGKVAVTVGISGTGGGFAKFCRGETDVQDASRPISTKELEECRKSGIKFVELPVAYEGIVVAVNKKSPISEISVDELKKLWSPEAGGKITIWNQVNEKWGDKKISLYGAGADSGTFDYFNEAINGGPKLSRKDYNPTEDDNVTVTGVSRNEGALGYLPLSYAETNTDKLKIVNIIGGEKSPLKGKAVAPSEASIIDGTYYPLSRPLFIYVSEKSLAKTEVKEFIKFYLSEGAKLVKEVKMVALPDSAYKTALAHFENKKLGSVFGGKLEVGLRIEELLKREAKF